MRARSRAPAGNAVGRGERAPSDPRARGGEPGSVAGAASAPRPPAFTPYPRGSGYCARRRDGRGRAGAGGSGAGPAVLLTPRPARWLRAARDLGRTLPGGVGSREEGVSSHPPGWPRGGPRRGGTHAGRKPVGARPAARALPSLASDPGARAPAKWGRCHDKLGCEFASTNSTWPSAFGLENSTKVKS